MLGCIERGISPLQQRFDGISGSSLGNSEARGAATAASCLGGAEGEAYTFGEPFGTCSVGVPAQDDEFLATPARRKIITATALFEQFCKTAQDFIADRMARRVVDSLEVIDVGDWQFQ